MPRVIYSHFKTEHATGGRERRLDIYAILFPRTAQRPTMVRFAAFGMFVTLV
jgi:hypothetical protein